MAKKKKEVKKIAPIKVEPIEAQYYWCVNCGYHGDYGYVRKRNLKCEECGYDELTPFSEKEIKEMKIDNMALDKFKLKEEKPSKNHTKYVKALDEAKELLELPKEQTIAEKLAAIRNM